MMKDDFSTNVILSIKGGQMVNGEENTMELVTEGTLQKIDDKYKIVYKETEITGMGNTVTTIDIIPEKIKITRTGDVNSELIFEQDKKNTTYYETENMPFTVSIYTNVLFSEIDENGGEINLKYLLSLDNNEPSINEFNMNIRRKA